MIEGMVSQYLNGWMDINLNVDGWIMKQLVNKNIIYD